MTPGGLPATPGEDPEQIGRAVDNAAEAYAAAQEGRLERSRFARARDAGDQRVLELDLEDLTGPTNPATLEFILGRRGAGGPIRLVLDRNANRKDVEISQAELRAIAITATAALAWTMQAP